MKEIKIFKINDISYYEGEFSSFVFSCIEFNFNDNSEKEFKDYIKSIFCKVLNEYRCYCFFFIGHINTSKIDKRKNEIVLENIVSGAEVGYLQMDGGVFACFEVDLSNFEEVYGVQHTFIFSKKSNFITSIVKNMEASSYDAFVKIFTCLPYSSSFFGDFDQLHDNYYTPLFEQCLNGDFIVATHFSEIYSETKSLGFCSKKGIDCPILIDLGKGNEVTR